MKFEAAMEEMRRSGRTARRPGLPLEITTNHPDGRLRIAGRDGVAVVWRPDRESLEAEDWEVKP